MSDAGATTPRTRRTRAELRELMIDAGAEVLRDRGVETHIASLTYAQVFEHLQATRDIKVTYGSVHERIWSSIAAYQIDVIDRAGIWSPNVRPEADLPAMTSRVIADGPPDNNADDPRHTLHQALRRLAAHDDPADEQAWTEWLSSTAAMSTLDPSTASRAATADAARARYATIDDNVADGIRATLDRLGLRPRADVVGEDDDPVLVAARVVTALTEGTRLRTHLTDTTEPTVSRPSGEDRAAQSWQIHAVAMAAVVDLLFESVH